MRDGAGFANCDKTLSLLGQSVNVTLVIGQADMYIYTSTSGSAPIFDYCPANCLKDTPPDPLLSMKRSWGSADRKRLRVCRSSLIQRPLKISGKKVQGTFNSPY